MIELFVGDLLVYAASRIQPMRRLFSIKGGLAVAGSIALIASLLFGVSKTLSRIKELSASSSAGATMPHAFLWAWERPVDLSFINPNHVGVAVLARTIRLRSNEIVVRPRLQPLDLPEGAMVIAVARVESDVRTKPSLSTEQRDKLVEAIAEMSRLPNLAGIQIDFDATRSERDFYRSLITDVRRRVAPDLRLSITALASWCADDDWLSDLPIDEAVPMLFRMGMDRRRFQDGLADGQQFSSVKCQDSYGISTDEPVQNLKSSKRFYVFSPDAWTESSVRAALESAK